ncbi:hypothetical protein FOCC_FOCC002929 [Frankliniella occidentalis]|nr:hypothetical protein FOCC_FOCC002929 [Frankliniella occidentalis]
MGDVLMDDNSRKYLWDSGNNTGALTMLLLLLLLFRMLLTAAMAEEDAMVSSRSAGVRCGAARSWQRG